MIESIISLLLLILPGYSLLNIKWIRLKINFNKIDKIIFGFIIWIFYIVSSILIIKIIMPKYLKVIFLFNYFFGFILVGCWFLTELLGKLSQSYSYHIKFPLIKLFFGGFLAFLVPMIAFLVLITLYTPIIYQYDALAIYLIVARKLLLGSTSLVKTWPIFEDSMPVMPILYSWFFYLSDNPILRLIPLLFLFLIMILIYAIGKKIFLQNIYAPYISMICFISMTVLHWYMSKVSLYLDLSYIFFSASSFYLLIKNIDKNLTIKNFFILGINMTILILSKEYGVFNAWFILIFIIFFYIKHCIKGIYQGLIISTLLILPFMIYHISFTLYFTYYEADIISSTTFFRLLIIILFILLLIINYNIKNYEISIPKLSHIIITIIPISIPILFFIKNIFLIKVPFGNFKEPYIQQLLNLNIVFTTWKENNYTFLNILDVFLTNTMIAPNLLPFITYIVTLLLPQFKKMKNWFSTLLAFWFLYELFIFYFINFGFIEGGLVRRILPLALPLALMVGGGVNYILINSSLPNWVGIVAYTSVTSLYLAHIWFVKLDVSKSWIINLDSLTNHCAKASYLEILIYAIPWVLLSISIIARRSWFGRLNIFSKGFWTWMGLTLLLITAVTPVAMFNQSIKSIKIWNPAYYDEANSVKQYEDHWFIPVIQFYHSSLIDENSLTIGFGVTPLQYFLERPFIDLAHPRNWLIHSSLIQPISTDELLYYLEKFNALYFMTPNEVYPTRDRYEAALKSSTLFKMIDTSAIVQRSDGQIFKFEMLANFVPFKLYVLKRLPITK